MAKVSAVDNTYNFKRNNVLRNTFIAGGTGAAISSAIEYNGQKLLKQEGNLGAANDIMNNMVNKKAFAIAGSIGAAIIGGSYLLGNGIRTILLHNQK